MKDAKAATATKTGAQEKEKWTAENKYKDFLKTTISSSRMAISFFMKEGSQA